MSYEYLQLGSWNVICDRCGFQYKAEQLKEEWTGAIVCRGPGTNDCWEPRNQQDYVRPRPEETSIQDRAGEPPDSFVSVTYVDSSVGVQANTVPSGTFDNSI